MLVVGVDGGGTYTRACLMNQNGIVLGIGQAGPSSIDTVSKDRTQRSIQTAIEEAFLQAKIDPQPINSIFVGLGGVLTSRTKELVRELLLDISYVNNRTLIQIENDAYSAHLGGLSNRPGIILIAGTGSVAFGIDEQGNTHRAGGYGYQEGDHGSAYHLGRRAMQAMARAFDGRLQHDAFTDALYSHLKIKDLDNLLQTIQALHQNRTQMAALAPIVTHFANQGHPLAQSICDEGVAALKECVQAVCNALDLKNKEIAIIGSLGNSEGYFKDRLYQSLLDLDPDFSIHPPLNEPVIGSAYKALQNLVGTIG